MAKKKSGTTHKRQIAKGKKVQATIQTVMEKAEATKLKSKARLTRLVPKVIAGEKLPRISIRDKIDLLEFLPKTSKQRLEKWIAHIFRKSKLL